MEDVGIFYSFGPFYGQLVCPIPHLVYFMAIRYISPHIGMWNQENLATLDAKSKSFKGMQQARHA
jgi:hypothetical protein